MPLSARELVLIMRARDEASRAIRQAGGSIRTLGDDGAIAADKLAAVGTSMLTIGSALAGAGALGVGFLDGATNSAIDYNKQAALTLTQAGDVGTSLEELKEIGINVGNEIPVAFDSIQDSLFDIFSTVNATVPEAEGALRGFAKAAVAGDADISSVSRTTLAALNAWQLPLEDTTRLLDLQFKLVEKGAGTYDQFSGAIGRAIPAAVASGQTFETLAGAMAFLTRNGLSTEQAATSAARAMELFADPKVTGRLEGIGVAVKDQNGEFKQLDAIITDLSTNAGWAEMTDPQRKEAFAEIFGRGSIQARRFFDTAIPNFEQFNGLTDEMRDSAGSLDRAYDIMFEQPANQIQLLKNQYEGIRTEIGDMLIPAKLRLMEAIRDLFNWWNNLSDSTKSLIIRIAAVVSVFMLVIGTVIAVVGGFLLFVGIIAPIVGGVGALAAAFGWALLAVAAVAVVAWLLYDNWEAVKNFLIPIWDAIVGAFNSFVNTWKSGETDITSSGFNGFMERLAIFIRDTVVPALIWLGQAFLTAAGWIWDFAKRVPGFIQMVWDKIMEWWNWLKDTFGPGIAELRQVLSEEFGGIWVEIVETFDLIMAKANEYWEEWQRIWKIVGPVVREAFDEIMDVVAVALQWIQDQWNAWGPTLLAIIRAIWDQFVNTITFAIKIISNVIQLGLNLIQGDWSGAWENIKAIFGATWDFLVRTLRNAWNIVFAIFAGALRSLRATWDAIVTLLTTKGREAMNGLWEAMKGVWNSVGAWMRRRREVIRGYFNGAGRWLFNIGKQILQGLLDGIKNKVGAIKDELQNLTGLIPGWKGPIEVDRKLLFDSGQQIMAGLGRGLSSGFVDVRSLLNSMTTESNFAPNVGVTALGRDNSAQLMPFLAQMMMERNEREERRGGLIVEGDLVVGDNPNAVDDLDWWAQTRLGGA